MPNSAVLIAPAIVTNIFPSFCKWDIQLSAASTHTAALKCLKFFCMNSRIFMTTPFELVA
jgi:hypothetical protein